MKKTLKIILISAILLTSFGVVSAAINTTNSRIPVPVDAVPATTYLFDLPVNMSSTLQVVGNLTDPNGNKYSTSTGGSGTQLASSGPWTANYLPLIVDGNNLTRSWIAQIGNGLSISTGTAGGWPIQSSTSSLLQLGTSTILGANASGTFFGINASSGFNGDFLNFQLNSSTKFLVNSSGSLSIGTGTPVGGALFTIATSSNIFTVLANGNVGVGSSSPGQALVVKGTVVATQYREDAGFNGANPQYSDLLGTSGMSVNSNGAYFQSIGNSDVAFNALGLIVTSGLGIGWGNGAASGVSFDTSISRVGAGVMALGTGAQGSLAGTFLTSNIGIGTTASNTTYSALTVAGLPPQSSTSTRVLLGSNFITGGNASGTFLGANPTSTFNGDFINFQVASATKFQVSAVGETTIAGNTNYPTSTVSVSACGTNPTITGSNNGGIVTLGTGGLSSCTITFATSTPQHPNSGWNNAPVCTVEDSSSTDSADPQTITTSTLVAGFPLTIQGGTLWYTCQGNPS